MATKRYLKLGEALVQEGLITQQQLADAIEAQRKNPSQFLGSILLGKGWVAEKDLAIVLSKQLDIPYASKESGILKPSVDAELAKLVPEEFARKNHVLPLHKHLNSLTLALPDPTDLVLLDNLKKMTGCNIQRVIATMNDIDASISKFYGEGGLLKTAVAASYAEDITLIPEAREEQLSLDSVVQNAEQAPVIKMTDLIIRKAIKDRASDIHIEPLPNKISIRFRIDGVLHEIAPPNKTMFLALISRLKILSKMDIAEKRLPQDGSFNANIEGRSIDFRVSTIPTIYGEKMVLRILDRSSTPLDLQALGFSEQNMELYRKVIRKPYGLILITGPTGSGKTTTLYAALNELNGQDKNIITIEDPVEYKMPGINQVQVKASIGLTFANGLRAFLRQDPDIILVGETRDAETAQICVRAALTGHLVFSTLHTNDAPSAINRLIDIGVEPFFVANSLLMVMAQRLVRRLCPKCKEPSEPNKALLSKRFVWNKEKIYKAKGCEHCAGTGYSGRMAIHEVMLMTERLQELVSQRVTSTVLRDEAKKSGMLYLEESGYQKVLAGETSLEEVLRVTMPIE